MSKTSGKGRPIPNSYWVMPGRLAAGEYPGEVDAQETAAKLRCLLEAGINHFVDLTESGERTEQGELVPYHQMAEEEADDLNVTVQCARCPIPDTQVPDTPGAMAAILDAIDSALNQGRTVYVHCWGGVGRTGTVVGCWLIRHGRTGEEALAQIADWWQGVAKAYRQPQSPSERVQREYVRQWMEPDG